MLRLSVNEKLRRPRQQASDALTYLGLWALGTGPHLQPLTNSFLYLRGRSLRYCSLDKPLAMEDKPRP